MWGQRILIVEEAVRMMTRWWLSLFFLMVSGGCGGGCRLGDKNLLDRSFARRMYLLRWWMTMTTNDSTRLNVHKYN
ncbi:hypothetical protein HanIR_Chr08g0354161 [Helianthus annuus]|nr:hypothetical protein HanIR_Chr08g0354161 [Helianthus annuus]